MQKRPAKRTPIKPFVIGDPGSTHDGSFVKALTLINIAADCGLDAVKFQLLSPEQERGQNIGMNWEWLPALIDEGIKRKIEVFASVFNMEGVQWLIKYGCKSVKFAYSQLLLHKVSAHLHNNFDKVYMSTDVMNGVFENTINLYCIPQYPVPFIVDFEGLFPKFNGFSSHCLGIRQEQAALRAGAKYLELHYQGKWESNTPDGKFAKTPKELGKLMRIIK